LYARILGDSWCQVAEPVRRLHTTRSITRVHGHLHIEHGRRAVARLLARVLRLPPAHAAAETRLTITARGDCEHWARTFNGHVLDTIQSESGDRELLERFGPLEFRFRLEASTGSLIYIQNRVTFVWSRLRLQIPPRWAPRIDAREDAADAERVQVTVHIAVPRIGMLISYRGIVAFESTTS
jgi:Domain of unknown function (DUF4166)